MKRIIALVIGVASTLISLAQPFANDWIDYSPNKTYLKFKVVENSLYKIEYATLNFALQSIGKNISNIDPRSIQLFGRGQEQYIHIEGESDGVFNTTDYIEFYAEKNDAWLDESMYPSSEELTNPYYSLYNDTATYFLTWHEDASFSSFRYQSIANGTPVSTPVSYVLSNLVRTYTNVYQLGKDLGSGVSKAPYHGGKGWMSTNFGYNNGSVPSLSAHTFNTPSVYSGVGAPNASLEVALAGINIGASSSGNAHHVQVQFTPSGGSSSVLSDVLYKSFDYVRDVSSISPTAMNATASIKLACSQSISLLTTTSDYSACAYISLIYPRTLAFDDESTFSFIMPANSAPLFFNASNFTNNATNHLYDLDDHKRYEVNHSTSVGSVKCNIQPGADRKMFLSAQSSIKVIGTQDLIPAGNNGVFLNPFDLEKDSAYVIITHSTLFTQAQSYANYRNNSFNTVLIDIEDLYDQFAFGIRKHPLAIKNFLDFAIENWNSKPQYLFLIGKSIEEQSMRKNSTYAASSLVPCIGNPVSDAMLSSGLSGEKFYVPAIPTGRLAADNGSKVNVYLNKVREFENAQNIQITPYTITNRQWQKHILHFAGGDNAIENTRFKSYLSGYQSYAEDSLFGGKTFLFSKTSGTVIEQLNTDSVRLLIEQGAALMTFFGHASGNTFDLSVDDPSLWNNKGRYPMVIANSCYSGNIHLPSSAVTSISEEYLFTPDEGAIAFIASPDLSYETTLNSYTRALYKNLSLSNYGRGMGKHMKESSNAMTSDDLYSGIALEMTLHGDPALEVYPHDKTELTINDPLRGADIKYYPSNVTSDIDSFEVRINISNIGRSTGKEFALSATRTFPNGKEPETKSVVVDGINYTKEISIKFATNPEDAIGENLLEITVDLPSDLVDEFIESSNNTIARSSFIVSSSEIFPVYPYNYAVIPSFDVTIKANTGYPFLPAAEYIFELDTTDTYASPFKKTTSITQQGAVIEWKPGLENLAFADSTVFFWRVTPASDKTKWREFSFQVIDQKTGWGQDHFYQYKNNAFDLLDYNRPQKKFSFLETSRELLVNVLGNPSLSNNQELFATRYSLNGQDGEYGVAPGGTPSMAVAIIDTTDLKPWGTYGIEDGVFKNADHQFGNSNNYSTVDGRAKRVEYWFSFGVKNPAQMDAMVDLITNSVPDGYFILVYTLVNGLFDDPNVYWQNTHFSAFENLGADSIRYAGNKHPYIFFTKKGVPSSTIEVLGKSDRDIIELRTNIESSLKFGEMTSTQIGPAMNWGKFYQKERALESNSQDSVISAFTGISLEGNRSPFDSLFASDFTDISSLDANEFPYADLNFYTEDNQNSTPAQLKNWHVLYDPAPDAAINPIKGQTLREGETVFAGVDLNFGVAFENISEYNFGTFKVRYTLVDRQGNTIDERSLTYPKLEANEVVFDSVVFSTSGLSGRYFIYMEVNPTGTDWHKEQYHFNNLSYLAFDIEADTKNPLLDVTFDGVHILNGDIVSPTPEIKMELKDENQYLLMDDTASFDVFISQNAGTERRIPFVSNGKEVMTFEPATDKNNKAKITYLPSAAFEDGDYTMKVMGRDATGNESGDEAYTIDFEVINRSTVTRVMNYPNPFTTATRFVFTLTGSVIPDVFTVQIMTITGKVVREITKDELGPIHIGRNMTEYAWDGRDEYGDRLANGVYLYRVIMKINGSQIENRETAADDYFTKEFGKMYLFR